jgi:FHA domain-containing protein
MSVVPESADNTVSWVCRDCRHPNPPGTENCLYCGLYILFEHDTDEQETSSGAEDESQQPQDSADSAGTTCPECDAVGTVVNNRCSNCQWTSAVGLTLKWRDERIKNIAISGDCPVFIGRVPPVDSALAQHIEANYQTVSRLHAELYLDKDGSLYLRDMGSQNGTKINEERIQKFKPVKLKSGDVVAFSSSLCGQVE